MTTPDSEFPEAELARLADGSLSSAAQSELRARVQESPELKRALDEQRRALAMVRSVDVPAPDALRARVREQLAADRPGRRITRQRLRIRLALPVAGALAAAVTLMLVLVLGEGASGPSIDQAARIALATPTAPAPAADPADPVSLELAVGGIRFPNWGATKRWPAVGRRSDLLAGRRVQTVFYTVPRGYRVGYAIVPGPAIAVSGGQTVARRGVRYTLLNAGGGEVVTWVRSGHTCVIAGRDVGGATLLALASA